MRIRGLAILFLGVVVAPSLFLAPARECRAAAEAEGEGAASGTNAGQSADTLRLSLDDCISRALAIGEEMKLADADLANARAVYLQARSTALPQINTTGVYTRQIESIFRQGGLGGDIEEFEPDTTAPLDQRVREIEKALPGSGLTGLAGLFSSTSFGSKNTWVTSIGITQRLFQGGSIWGSIAAARHAMRSAHASKNSRQADVVLGVREAYLSALLADRHVRIAGLALEQAESQLTRVRLRQEAGEVSEFELLQADVERENQVPVVMRARAEREVAYLDLARLANLPVARPVRLTTELLNKGSLPAQPGAVDTTGLVEAALRTMGICALEEFSAAREHGVTVAKADRWPDFSIFANYSRQAFPGDLFPKSGQWRKDINAGAQVTWTLFDGFLTKGAIEQSKARLSESRQSLNQAREAIREAVIQSRWELDRSASDLSARSRTVEIGRRAYELAKLRFDEGASSLMEVNDARIAFQIAQTNEAQALHDYFLALARLERFSDRPLFTSAAQSAGSGQ